MRAILFESNPTIAEALIKSAKSAKIDLDVVYNREEVLSLFESDLKNYSAILVGNIEESPEVLDTLRRRGVDAPLVVLSDHRQSEYAIKCFSAGADDFVVKPFNPLELRARIHAVERRQGGRKTNSSELGGLTIYEDGRDPEASGVRIKLSHREHAIFHFLYRNLGRIVTKEAVYEAVYGAMDCEPFEKVIDVYICKLRKKLADATDGQEFIETVYCRGYKMDKPENTVGRRLGRRRKAA